MYLQPLSRTVGTMAVCKHCFSLSLLLMTVEAFVVSVDQDQTALNVHSDL